MASSHKVVCNTYYFLGRQEAVEWEGLSGFLVCLNLCRGASLCCDLWMVLGASSPCFTPFLPRPGSVPPEDMENQTVIPWHCSGAHYQLHTNPWQLCAEPLHVGGNLPHDFSVQSQWTEKEHFAFLLFFFLIYIFSIQETWVGLRTLTPNFSSNL